MARIATKRTPAIQKHLPIAEIRDDCVVMRDGTLRAVLLVSSINFALKSEDEQNAIIAGYVSFLNSLEYPLQIVIQSRGLDLDNYLAELKVAEQEQKNELLRLQTAEYRQFVADMVELGDIMIKRFLVIVLYDPLSNRKRSFWQRAGDVLSPTGVISLSEKRFLSRRKDLFVRVDKIISGLSSMGLKTSPLNTQALIELYYNTYNPVVSQSQKMAEVDKLRVDE